MEKQMVFIIGSSRSGTTWLQALLASHPRVCAYAELKLFNNYVGPLIQSWERDQHDTLPSGLPTTWSEEEFYAYLQELVTRTYERVFTTKPGATILVDKHPGDVDVINRFVPTAKFIHVIRDGRDVAVSLLAASEGWARWWSPKTIQDAAKWWTVGVRNGQKARQYGSRYVEVRYEELSSNGPHVLASVFDFIGVPITPAMADAYLEENRIDKMRDKKTVGAFTMPEGFFRRGDCGEWRQALTPIQKYRFHEAAGDLLCELGYATSSWWIERGVQRFLLPARAVLRAPRHARREALILAVKNMLGPERTSKIRLRYKKLSHQSTAAQR